MYSSALPSCLVQGKQEVGWLQHFGEKPLPAQLSGSLIEKTYASWGLWIWLSGHGNFSLPSGLWDPRYLLPSGQLAHGGNGAGQHPVSRKEFE